MEPPPVMTAHIARQGQRVPQESCLSAKWQSGFIDLIGKGAFPLLSEELAWACQQGVPLDLSTRAEK